MKNRIIKFRAWDKANVNCYNSPSDKKRMSFYGSEFDMDDDKNCLSFFTPKGKQPPFGDHNSQERYILMQYTGFKDRKGKEIFEGDIIEDKEFRGKRIVYFDIQSAGYFLKGLDGWNGFDNDREFLPLAATALKTKKIIGNIYENPKLIKK